MGQIRDELQERHDDKAVERRRKAGDWPPDKEVRAAELLRLCRETWQPGKQGAGE